DEVPVADEDAQLFRGNVGEVDHHEVRVRRLVEIEGRPPARPSGDGPRAVNQLLEQVVNLLVQIEKRRLPGTQHGITSQGTTSGRSAIGANMMPMHSEMPLALEPPYLGGS